VGLSFDNVNLKFRSNGPGKLFKCLNSRFSTHNNGRKILVVVFEFPGAALGFKNNIFGGPWCGNGWTALDWGI